MLSIAEIIANENDIRNEISVRKSVAPTDFQNFNLQNNNIKCSKTTFGVGKTKGLLLIIAIIVHSKKIKAMDNNGNPIFLKIEFVIVFLVITI